MRASYPTRTEFGFAQRGALVRGISWGLTYEEWRDWWLEGDRWARKCAAPQMVLMARVDRSRGFVLDNIVERGRSEFAREILAPYRRRGNPDWSEGCAGTWLGKTGAAHPRSKVVITPCGEFESATQAGAYYGITRETAARKVQTR